MNANKGFPKTLLCVDYIDRVVDGCDSAVRWTIVMRNICITPKAIHLLYDGNCLYSITLYDWNFVKANDFRKSFKWIENIGTNPLMLTIFWLLFGAFEFHHTHAPIYLHSKRREIIVWILYWHTELTSFEYRCTHTHCYCLCRKQCVLNNIDTHNEICQFQLKKKSNLLNQTRLLLNEKIII